MAPEKNHAPQTTHRLSMLITFSKRRAILNNILTEACGDSITMYTYFNIC